MSNLTPEKIKKRAAIFALLLIGMYFTYNIVKSTLKWSILGGMIYVGIINFIAGNHTAYSIIGAVAFFYAGGIGLFNCSKSNRMPPK